VNAPPFRFRLERVRELREHAEDCAREELASSLGAQLRGQAMLQAASEAVQGAHVATREGAQTGAMSAADLYAQQLYVERLERQRSDAELALDRASAEVDARRGALVEASRKREALERLKARKRQEHTAHVQRLEGAFLDEIASTSYVRQASGTTRADVRASASAGGVVG
jgi:flagellar FliJ protein